MPFCAYLVQISTTFFAVGDAGGSGAVQLDIGFNEFDPRGMRR